MLYDGLEELTELMINYLASDKCAPSRYEGTLQSAVKL